MLKLVKLYKKYSHKRNKSYIKEDDKCWCCGGKKEVMHVYMFEMNEITLA
jgi:ribosomal protein S14